MILENYETNLIINNCSPFQLSTNCRQLNKKRTDKYQSYLTKLAGLQCFDTMEQNRTLWNTDPQFKSSFRYLYSAE